MSYTRQRGEYLISCDRALLDFEEVCRLLKNTGWGKESSVDRVAQAAKYSLPFGLHRHGDASLELIGYGRAMSDFVTLAYLMDIYVAPTYRGQGLGLWLMEVIMDHPELRAVEGWMLETRDAHGLYAKVGFVPVRDPAWLMSCSRLGVRRTATE